MPYAPCAMLLNPQSKIPARHREPLRRGGRAKSEIKILCLLPSVLCLLSSVICHLTSDPELPACSRNVLSLAAANDDGVIFGE